MANYKNPWEDVANQAVGALYKHYASKPSAADMQRGQMQNQLLGLQIQGEQMGLDKARVAAQRAQQQQDFSNKFADAFGAVPSVNNDVVPQDPSQFGPVEPFTQNDRNSGIADVFEQFAPRLDKDTIEAARGALGASNALRFEDPIQRQLAMDEKATSYEALTPGYTLGAGQVRFDADNEQLARAPLKDANTPYTLSPGSVRFGADNEQLASAPFKPGGAGTYVQTPDGTVVSVDGGMPNKLNPTKTTVNDLQKQQVATEKVRGLMDYTRSLASENPMNFGFPGFVKGGVQDVSTLLSGVTTAMGYENPGQAVNTARQDVLNNGINPELLSGLFDPTLPALQTANDLLVYQAAAALAGQSGRDLSDRDVRNMKNIIGSSTDWFTSQDKFMSKLNVIEDILGLNEQVVDQTLGGSVVGPMDDRQQPLPTPPPVQKWIRGPDGTPIPAGGQ